MEFVHDDGGRKAAGFKGEAGDCVTRAIAIATGLPYLEVYRALTDAKKGERLLRKRKGTARNGVPKTTTRRYLTALGWTWTPTMGIGTGCKVHLCAEELPKGPLIVQVSKHLTYVEDGVLFDTYDCSRDETRCVYGYWRPSSEATCGIQGAR